MSEKRQSLAVGKIPNLAAGKGFQLYASTVFTLKGMIIRRMGYV